MRHFSIRSNSDIIRTSERPDDNVQSLRLTVEQADNLRPVDGIERPEPIAGTDGDDFLEGTEGNDVIWAKDGNDTVEAGAGDDLIRAGDGDDDVRGGAGDDKIGGGKGADALSGGEGDDKLYGGAQNDTLTGGEGADQFLFKIGRPSGRPAPEAGDDVITDFSLADGDSLRIAGTQHMTSNFRYGDSDGDGLDDYTVISFTLNPRADGEEVLLPEGIELGTITLENTLLTADDLGL